jgi:predicted transcriptional regulator
MGITKTDLFSSEQNAMAHMAKVLGHPARIAILEYLVKSNSCVNGDLVQELGLAQATISQHLRELKEVGFIQGTIEGVSICYCINPEKWAEFSQLFGVFFDNYYVLKQSNCC